MDHQKKTPPINMDYFEDLTGKIKDGETSQEQELGNRIKQIRKDKKLSIENLSDLTGFEVSKLEDIESGRIKPQLGTLMRLSRSLDSAIGSLVSGMGTKLYSITRKNERKKVFRSTSKTSRKKLYSYMGLAPEVQGRHMEPLIVQLEKTKDKELSVHDGEEFIFALEGIVELTIGKDVYELEPGDSAYYLSTTSHFITAKTEKAAILAVLYE